MKSQEKNFFFKMKSSLTVPLNNRKILISKEYLSAAAEAGSVVLDLEDSVAVEQKDFARTLFVEAFDAYFQKNQAIFVRLNNHPHEAELDLKVCLQRPIRGIQMSKLSNTEQLRFFLNSLESKSQGRDNRQVQLIPIIETLRGLKNLGEMLKIYSPPCLYFGSEDMSLELGVEPSPESLWYAAHKTLFEAAVHEIPVFGICGPLCYYTAKNLDRFEDLLKLSKKMGFRGAPAVHPRQIALINKIYGTSEEELEIYKKVIAKDRKNPIFSVDGLMYGPPMVKRIKKNLSQIE